MAAQGLPCRRFGGLAPSFAQVSSLIRFFLPLVVGLALVGHFVHPPQAVATVMAELSFDELVARADAVVLARVRRTGPRTVATRGRLETVTVTTLDVREWTKGEGGATVVVVERGGAHAGGRTVALGTPTYAPGEWVVAFLVRGESAYRTLAMAQGKFRVQDANDPARARVIRDLRGLAYVDRGARVTHGAVSDAEPLGAFLDRVREATRRRGTP
jgi:hypothetical protein